MAALSRQIAVIEEFMDMSKLEQILPFNALEQIRVLVRLDGAVRLFPEDRRAEAMTHISLCDGVMQATLQRLLETRKPAPHQNSELIAKLEQRIRRGGIALDEFEHRPAADDALSASDIATIATMGYCDFRYTEEWRSFCPGLAEWYATNAELSLARATAPTCKTPASVR